MSKIEHPNSHLFKKKNVNEAKKFDRRNDFNNPKRQLRIKEEAELIEKFLKERK